MNPFVPQIAQKTDDPRRLRRNHSWTIAICYADGGPSHYAIVQMLTQDCPEDCRSKVFNDLVDRCNGQNLKRFPKTFQPLFQKEMDKVFNQ